LGLPVGKLDPPGGVGAGPRFLAGCYDRDDEPKSPHVSAKELRAYQTARSLRHRNTALLD